MLCADVVLGRRVGLGLGEQVFCIRHVSPVWALPAGGSARPRSAGLGYGAKQALVCLGSVLWGVIAPGVVLE